ncbi:MAG: amino acid ABC transporter substrate-binding protein [Hyphomicrobiales bacterium]
MCLALAAGSGGASAGVLEDIRARGKLRCGVNVGLAGFAVKGEKGDWRGLDIDICRAVAATALGDPEKAKFKDIPVRDSLSALKSGEIDLLTRNLAWTMGRETLFGLRFAGVVFHDGQGFLVRKKLGIVSALELSGATVCVQSGTTATANTAEFFRSRQMKHELVPFAGPEEVLQAYEAGRCQAVAADITQLSAMRLRLSRPDEHMALPEIISKEPLGPVVMQGDEQWANLVKWTIYALINAEELGVTAANAEAMRKSPNPDIRRLLGTEGNFGEGLGLDQDWAYRAIRAVGNYGEIYERNLGAGSPLNVPRGVNKLWNRGGILYAPPIR